MFLSRLIWYFILLHEILFEIIVSIQWSSHIYDLIYLFKYNVISKTYLITALQISFLYWKVKLMNINLKAVVCLPQARGGGLANPLLKYKKCGGLCWGQSNHIDSKMFSRTWNLTESWRRLVVGLCRDLNMYPYKVQLVQSSVLLLLL